MLKHFHYEKVIFLHSSDTDGRSILGRFQTNAQNLEDDIEIKVHKPIGNFRKNSEPYMKILNYLQIEMVIELEPGSRSDNYKAKLTELRNAQARVYLLYARYRC